MEIREDRKAPVWSKGFRAQEALVQFNSCTFFLLIGSNYLLYVQVWKINLILLQPLSPPPTAPHTGWTGVKSPQSHLGHGQPHQPPQRRPVKLCALTLGGEMQSRLLNPERGCLI